MGVLYYTAVRVYHICATVAMSTMYTACMAYGLWDMNARSTKYVLVNDTCLTNYVRISNHNSYGVRK